MQRRYLTVLFLLGFSFAMLSLSAIAQVVVATVPTQGSPSGAAVNPQTNKIYVTNYCGSDPSCQSNGTVTVIDGVTNSTATVSVGSHPLSVAVSPVTNKIYVYNVCGNDPLCKTFKGTVTVIDGATLTTVTLSAGFGQGPNGLNIVAVNPVTNKIYVVNSCGNDASCKSNGTVTAIDGATDATTSIMVGFSPFAVAVNAVTNKIYVANRCGNDPTCGSGGTVTAIDAANNNTTTSVVVGSGPDALGINAITNKIYVDNFQSNSVTVIDAANNNTTTSVTVGSGPYAVATNAVTNEIYVVNSGGNTVIAIDAANNNSTTTIPVGTTPVVVSVNPVTNKIYISNLNSDSVTVIDGVTDSPVTVLVGSGPFGMAVNQVTNVIYVANQRDNTVSVIAGASGAPLQFVAVTPCRVVDTRNANGEFGGPPIQGQTSRSFPIPQGSCNIPATAAGYSLNITLVPIQNAPVGYLTIWPTGEDQPLVSTMNSLDGRIKANAAIVPAGYHGATSVYVTNTTNVVLDIDGYFAPTSGSTLAFYPLTPCRVLDTRNPNGPLGGPFLASGQERDFPVLSSNCNIPGSAQAYSMNFTVVPYNGEPLGYLTVWPQGTQRPVVSTLNNLTATIVANAAVVPAGTGGGIAAYPSGNTQLVADIDGYFAAPGPGGLSLYTEAPCRVLDTRKGDGAFSGELTVNVVGSACTPPSTAQAYVFNATVVPQGSLGYLTLWPDGEGQPVVSTLNAIDGAIASNMAIVPNLDGKTDAYASGITQLILDIFSYFAP
jgi:YVTN family beta-propeller protein